MSDAKVSLDRLDRFVRQPDVENYRAAIKDDSQGSSAGGARVGIAIRGGEFFWEHPDARKTRLKLKAGEHGCLILWGFRER